MGRFGGRGSEVEGAQELSPRFSGRNSPNNPGDHSLASVEEREKEDQHLKLPGET